jgi:uncharacterized flavoprotein (TIGR03862 family)
MNDEESAPSKVELAVVGGGPAGLMAAEVARAAGVEVDLYEGTGSVGRKFLLAGKGGLNLTHSEPFAAFVKRYGAREAEVARWLRDFDADALRHWARELGVETFVGTSGRVFPVGLKAAPLLRGWVRRLREQGVRFHVRHRCEGWDASGALRFGTPDGALRVRAQAMVLALGGGSWPQLGSDGAWASWLAPAGAEIAPLQPANCGFDVGWSAHFASRFAGRPVKPVMAVLHASAGMGYSQRGEFVVTDTGVEGSLIYALSAPLRDEIAAQGSALLQLDLAPGRDVARLARDLARPRAGRSLSEVLRRMAGFDAVKIGLIHEIVPKSELADAETLAARAKALPLKLVRARPLAEAISSAGGVRFEALDDHLMLRRRPGVFCAGEMLDWEAPTGGYLLTACLASGRCAGAGAAAWLRCMRSIDVTSITDPTRCGLQS